MLDIDGTALVMATDFGSIGYGTLEPGNGTQEEQISFSGLTNNANGTTTLTGVKTVDFQYPYTETSGLAKTHPGSATFIISNTSGFYNKQVSKDDDATITGKYTFPGGGNASAPVSGTVYAAPTADLEYAAKKYVDEVAIAGAPDANTTTKGIVQIATQAQVDAKTAAGSTGASLVPTPALARSTLLSDYVADTGTATSYAIAPSPTISAYAVGQRFAFKVTNTNTGTAILAVNALSGTLIYKNGAVPLTAGDLQIGQIVEVVYDANNGFQLITPVAPQAAPTGAMQMYAGATAPTGWLFCDGSAVSRTTYVTLFSVLSTTYGAGDASTTFNVPDMRGRVPVGVGTGTGGGASGTGAPTGGAALTAIARSTWKGEETHVLTVAELAAHTHTYHNFQSATGAVSPSTTMGDGTGANSDSGSTGSGTAHNNIQPVTGVNFIIKY